ncbi:CCA tRNA nucleotidyltransferase, mitochondrial [Emmonsiellopsis sp. PD_33]|nr:CCA tRNA nucleotidyltransferase, mitochondrial [Emmonsiellopsis sp. PD_33]
MTPHLARVLQRIHAASRRQLTHSTHSAVRHIATHPASSFIPRQISSARFPYETSRLCTQLAQTHMSLREPEADPAPVEPPRKRRRLDQPSLDSRRLMAHQVDTPAGLPQITLTPIEETLRLCLLDAAEFIKQKEKDTETAETAAKPDLVLRFAGGWVRDKLLGVNSHDIDVGINTMTGEKFGEGLKEYLDMPGVLEKYKQMHEEDPSVVDFIKIHKIKQNPDKSKHLETSTTKIFGLEIDLVNLRKETYTDDSRNPQIEFGTPEEDALRRDATVNALFYNIHTDSVEDFTGRGLQDMKDKIIRTPMAPYQTFKDDPLRVLRLIRFASRLGYEIDHDTEEAMKLEDIKAALKRKISQERIGVELEKTLRGPDPLMALQTINRLGLYDTIFANHRDDVAVDTTSWDRGYGALVHLLSESTEQPSKSLETQQHIRDILIRDKNDEYYAWFLAAIAPWATVSPHQSWKPGQKPPPARGATVARDSLRADNKAANILGAACNHYETISSMKTSFLNNEVATSAPEIRVKVGQFIRTVGHDWRLCMVLAILLDVMQGKEITEVFRDYEKFLSYIEESKLLDVTSLHPLINGREIIDATGAKRGPWLGKATEMVVEWQLRNPEATDKQGVIDEIMRRKHELGLDAKASSKDN